MTYGQNDIMAKYDFVWLVFAGPVLWTDKKPEPNWTCNRLGSILSNRLQPVFDYITIFAKSLQKWPKNDDFMGFYMYF